MHLRPRTKVFTRSFTAVVEPRLKLTIMAGMCVLAPMVRTGELPTRLLALKYGADLVWGSIFSPLDFYFATPISDTESWFLQAPKRWIWQFWAHGGL